MLETLLRKSTLAYLHLLTTANVKIVVFIKLNVMTESYYIVQTDRTF